MKRSILSLLVAGMFAGTGTLAIAQNVTAGDQPPAETSQTSPSAVPGNAKSGDAYNAAAAEAQATFTEANAKCDSLQGAEKTTCVSAAETARKDSLAEAKKKWENQPDQQSKNEGEDQAGDQVESQDGVSAPDSRTEANPQEQDPDKTTATESAAPNSAELGEISQQ